ncbi:hypothetical protein, partial [Kozakia baliensis]|uniref:hypothetical protein n=1 Tax=Kozakia baliensis TaxID=153496 RepID=UPI00222F12BE
HQPSLSQVRVNVTAPESRNSKTIGLTLRACGRSLNALQTLLQSVTVIANIDVSRAMITTARSLFR